MKILRAILFWPVLVGLIWYFISFQAAVVIAFLYLHAMIGLLTYTNRKTSDALQAVADEIEKIKV